MAFSTREMYILQFAERTSSALSLFCTFFIIATFLWGKDFQKPLTQLIFYAAWGNILSNVGTMIAMSGIVAGSDSGLCKAQGFFIQTFTMADAAWACCMATNVYLSFFRKYDLDMLNALAKKYRLLSYGIPLVFGFIYLFVHTNERGEVYGSAEIFCWVSPHYSFLWFAPFFGAISLLNCATIYMYAHGLQHIFAKRRQLRSIGSEHGRSRPVSGLWNTFLSGANPNPSLALASARPGTRSSVVSTLSSLGSQRRRSTARSGNANAAAYLRPVSIAVVGLLTTWAVPTAYYARAWALPEETCFGLALASAAVLPLQGFWNAAVYASASVPACKALGGRVVRVFGVVRPGSAGSRVGILGGAEG